MTTLLVTVNLELDPWADITPPDVAAHGALTRIGLLPQGMTSGRASIALLGTLPDGKHVVLETSWASIATAVHALAHSPVAQMEDL